MSAPVLVASCILSAYNRVAVGTRITDRDAFMAAATKAVAAYDFAAARQPGQGYIDAPECVPFVSAGVGQRTADPADYVCRQHRGEVGMFLRRELAAPCDGCALIVYTAEAYLSDPEIAAMDVEVRHIRDSGCTHVLVAVLASAGPRSPYSPERFVSNLAGGNKEALTWSAEEIRQKAAEVAAYAREWSVVAD